MTGVLMKRRDMCTETHIQEECYMNTKMKEEMTLQAKKCPRFPGNHQKPGDRPGPDSSLQPLENAFSDIQPPELGHPVCGPLLWQPLETGMLKMAGK